MNWDPTPLQTEASVYPVGDDRITVEIPGVKDANALLAELGTPGSVFVSSRRQMLMETRNYIL